MGAGNRRAAGRRWGAGIAGLAVAWIVAAPAVADTSTAPLEPLRAWGTETAATVRADGPRPAQQLRRLDRLVPDAARALRRASAGVRAREIALSRTALAQALDPVADRLDSAAGRALMLGYQGRLERLAERAGLDRAPTGRALRPEAANGDLDGDGVIDGGRIDEDGDGILDGLDSSDLGWGIPDTFRVRPPVGAPTDVGFCIRATEAVPVVRDVGDGRAWERRARRRGCDTPRPVVGVEWLAHAARSYRRTAADDGVAFRLTRATMAGNELTARITVPTDARADLTIAQQRVTSTETGDQDDDGERLRRRGLHLDKGTTTLRVRFDRPLAPGAARLTVVARDATNAPRSIRRWCARIEDYKDSERRSKRAKEKYETRKRLVDEAGWKCSEVRKPRRAPRKVRSWCRRIEAYRDSDSPSRSARKTYLTRLDLVSERGYRCKDGRPESIAMRASIPITVVPPTPVPVVGAGVVVPPPPPPAPPLPPAPPPSPCVDSRDSDGDGVSDCLETTGFDFIVYEAGAACAGTTRQFSCRRSKTRRVTSDPTRRNTDGDAVRLADGRVFELTDGEEWAFALSGGISDPSLQDSDEDGIGDVEELKRWGSAPNTADTDGDSTTNEETPVPPEPQLFDGAEIAGGVNGAERSPTSPTSTDTDGDGESDLEEVLDGTVNPAIAEVPEFDVAPDPAAPGVNLSLRVEESETVTLETVTTEEETTRREDERTTRELQQHRTEINAEVTLQGEIGAGIGTGGGGGGGGGGGKNDSGGGTKKKVGASIGLSGTVGVTYEYLTSKERTHTRRFTRESKRGSQKTYSETFSKSTAPEGTLSASFIVSNENPFTSIQLKNLRLFASFICLPRPGEVGCLDPDQNTVIPSPLIPDPEAFPEGLVLPAGSSRRVTLRADDVNASILKSIAANPTSLSFQPADADLFLPGDDQPLAATIGRSVPRSTAKLTIDDGLGNVRSILVAAGQGREWGKPSAFQAPPIPITDALDVAGVEYETFRNPDADGNEGQGLEVLETIDGRTAAPFREDLKVDGAWAIRGDSMPGDTADFSGISLPIGSDTHVFYVADRDGDGLFDREERRADTSDENPDSDGDGATRACDDAALPDDPYPCPQVFPDVYPSDLFELRVGWHVPVRRGQDDGYHVYSDPASCDGDRDISPDGPGGCPLAGLEAGTPYELVRGTDPALPDSDGDEVIDGEDPDPTFRPPRLWQEEFEPPDLVKVGGATDDLGTVRLSGAGDQVHTPPFTLCGAPGTDECTGATGFYKVTWDVTRGAATGNSAKLGTFRITSAPTTQFAPHDMLLEASLDRAELPLNGRPYSKDLYFAVGEADLEDMRFSLQGTDGVDLFVHDVELQRVGVPGASTNRKQFLDSGRDLQGDQRFAAIAFPGRMLASNPEAVREGAQGVGLVGSGVEDQWINQSFGPDFALAPSLGVAVARYGLRVTQRGGSRDTVVTVGVSAGDRPSNPTADVVLDDQNGYRDGLFDATPARRPLAMARVRRKDFADTYATTYLDVGFDVSHLTEYMSFPIATSPDIGAGDASLDNVVVDRAGSWTVDPTDLDDVDGLLGTIAGQGGLSMDDQTPIVRGIPWIGLGMVPQEPYFRTGAPRLLGGGVFLTSTGGDADGDPLSARTLAMPPGVNIPVHFWHHWAHVIEEDRSGRTCPKGSGTFAVFFEEDRSALITDYPLDPAPPTGQQAQQVRPAFQGFPLDYRFRAFFHRQSHLRSGAFNPVVLNLRDPEGDGFNDFTSHPFADASERSNSGADHVAGRIFRTRCQYSDGDGGDSNDGPMPIVRRMMLMTELPSPVRSAPR